MRFQKLKTKLLAATAVMIFALSSVAYAENETAPVLEYYESEAYLEECVINLRQQIVDTAMSFVGCPYRWGGTNPASGADCSGFVMYIMNSVAGISFPHSSSAQSHQGIQVSVEQLQPGDLAFYSNGGGINHVAIYIGNGQIVHSSNERNGVLISNLYNGRSPVKYMRLIQDVITEESCN